LPAKEPSLGVVRLVVQDKVQGVEALLGALGDLKVTAQLKNAMGYIFI
jgi:hypothetical protein